MTLRADVENGDYFEDDNVAYVILYKSDDALSIDSTTLKPSMTLTPTIIPTVSPTATPRSNYSPSGPVINSSVKPATTLAPIYTQIPSPSQTPVVTATPTTILAPTQTPTTPVPGSTDVPAASASPSPNVSPYIPATAAPVKKYITKTVGKFKYKLEEGNHVTASISGITNKKKKSVVIPSSVMIDGSIYKITKMEEDAFRNMKKLKSVKFGIHVEEVGKNAFRNCKKLRFIILPQKLQTIGAGAFRNCKKLKYWIIRSDRIAFVGTNAFKDI